MRFVLVDRITECEPGKRLSAVKALSLAEEYLADHFPAFPVLPGALMLEALTQAAAWLVRVSLDFSPTLLELEQARNVIYKSFLRPGELLELDVRAHRLDAEGSEFSGMGRCSGRDVFKARFSLLHDCLANQRPELAGLDEALRAHARAQYELLTGFVAPRSELVGDAR